MGRAGVRPGVWGGAQAAPRGLSVQQTRPHGLGACRLLHPGCVSALGDVCTLTESPPKDSFLGTRPVVRRCRTVLQGLTYMWNLEKVLNVQTHGTGWWQSEAGAEAGQSGRRGSKGTNFQLHNK